MLAGLTALLGGGNGGGGSYESIATVSASGGETSLSLTSIPSTYKHLELRWIARTSLASVGGGFFVRYNSDSSALYTKHSLWGDGANVNANDFGSDTETEITFGGAGANATASVFGTGVLSVLDYSSTSKYKTLRSFHGIDNNGSGYSQLSSGLWRSTSAITSITLTATSSKTFSASTKFALYGIKG